MRGEAALFGAGGLVLFELACASSLAARALGTDGAGGGGDALLGFAAFALGCAALVLVGIAGKRRRGRNGRDDRGPR